MPISTSLPRCGAVAIFVWSSGSIAAVNQAELWIAPKVAVALDNNTAVEIDTMMRLREDDRLSDTFYARLWLAQKLSDKFTLSAGIEGRSNTKGGLDETRFLQQIAVASGIWRARLRFEQRLVEASRLGLRIRTRGGVAVPLDHARKWNAFSDAELMFTLRAPNSSSFEGLTGVRTQIGVSAKVADNLSLSLGYVRNQEMRRGAPDTVGHAPIIGIDLSL